MVTTADGSWRWWGEKKLWRWELCASGEPGEPENTDTEEACYPRDLEQKCPMEL